MSSKTIKFWPVVFKQFLFKWNVNKDMFTTLAILQVIALFFSYSGSGTFHYMDGVELNFHTSDILIVFTMIWLLVIGVQILRPMNELPTYTMTANRKVDHMSNIVWLVVMSGIGTVTVLLASVLLQLIMNYMSGSIAIMPEVPLTFWSYITGAVTTFIYLIFAGAFGYFFSVLSQWNQLVKIIIPFFLIGTLFIAPAIIPDDLLISIFSFIFLEKVFIVFVLKMIVIISLLFAASIGIGNRLEVRK